MIDPGELVSETMRREFGEEALNSLEADSSKKEKIKTQVSELFKHGSEVWCSLTPMTHMPEIRTLTPEMWLWYFSCLTCISGTGFIWYQILASIWTLLLSDFCGWFVVPVSDMYVVDLSLFLSIPLQFIGKLISIWFLHMISLAVRSSVVLYITYWADGSLYSTH